MIPPHAGRDSPAGLGGRTGPISIHPPLAGRDRGRLRSCAHGTIFQSTRPLRGGTGPPTGVHGAGGFQSTRPLRGGTSHFVTLTLDAAFQSTRPLRGGTIWRGGEAVTQDISIHPPLAGRDSGLFAGQRASNISIHPPLAGRDSGDATFTTRSGYFNPPAPCGAGLFFENLKIGIVSFQSTRPLRGGTWSAG